MATVQTADGFTVDSTTEDEAAMRSALEMEPLKAEAVAEPADEVTEESAAAEDADVEEAAEEDKPKVAASTGKPDKRTREGRQASIRAQIDELTAQRHQTQAEVEKTRTELARLQDELAKARTQTQPKPEPAKPAAAKPSAFQRYSTMEGAPKFEDFASAGDSQFLEWNAAMTAFISRESYKEQREADAMAERSATARGKFQTRVQDEVAKDPGFTQKLQNTPIHPDIIPYVQQHESGVDIMMYLIEHQDIARRLTTLNPIEQIGQIGEIVGTIKARAEAASRGPARAPISNAKPPIKPLGGSPSVSDDVDEGDLPIESFIARGNKRDRAAGRL